MNQPILHTQTSTVQAQTFLSN